MAVGIVSVFMVVGGIVIMNIMLAVVTERTHEIGIRKSLGARRRDILNQFLVESSVLAGDGGLIGVAVAWMVAVLVRNTDFRAHGAAVVRRLYRSGAFGAWWGCSSASIRRARRRSSIPSRRCGWNVSMTRLAFINGIAAGAADHPRHKLRAFLTVLGVIIGTGTIIGVGAILTGFDASITGVLRSFGPNSIIVFKFPVGFRTQQLSPEERTRKNLTYENAVTSGSGAERSKTSRRCCSPTRASNAHYKGNDMYDVNLFGVEEA